MINSDENLKNDFPVVAFLYPSPFFELPNTLKLSSNLKRKQKKKTELIQYVFVVDKIRLCQVLLRLHEANPRIINWHLMRCALFDVNLGKLPTEEVKMVKKFKKEFQETTCREISFALFTGSLQKRKKKKKCW